MIFVKKKIIMKIENRIQIKEQQISLKVKKLRGIITVDDNLNYKQILIEELSKENSSFENS